MQIEVTSHCNEKCVHCYIPHSNRKDLKTNIVLDVLDQAKDMGTLGLMLSGGELFLHKDIEKILARAKKKHDFIITILSNGMLLTDDLIKLIKKTNINLIQISLYSMKPEA